MRGSVSVSVVVLALVMTLGAFAVALPIAGNGGTSSAIKQVRGGPMPMAGSSPRTVVVEVATGTWCPPCANADPAIVRLSDEYDPSRLVLLMYHVIWGRADPYENPTSIDRVNNFYNIDTAGIPTLVVDGGGAYTDDRLWSVGAYPSKSQNYGLYRGIIDPEMATGSNLRISLDTDLRPNTMDVSATILATDPVPQTNLSVRVVLYEDAIYYMGTNGEPYHRSVVRDMHQQRFWINMSETKTVTDSFGLVAEPTWVHNKLGVAVFVQTENKIPVSLPPTTILYNAEILQAARSDPVSPGISVYRDDTVADYTEPWERALSQGNRDFVTTNTLMAGDSGTTDIRGPPSAADLAAHPMVVWYTGTQTATINGAEQTLLTNYLANGNGNLLVTGENIGADLDSTPFYTDVLKASLVNGNAGATAVQGVSGDPVSGPWASTQLTFSGSSPDAVNPLGAGSVPFWYVGSGQGAGVRSDYDSDSRVLYLGYNYLEGGDSNRLNVVGSIVQWFDAKKAPVVGVQWPNGGETLMPGTSYKLTWSAKDVEIPSNGVDIYFTSDSSNPTWTLIASGEPNDGVFWWNPPAGIDSPLCLLKVVVRDGQGNAGQDLSNSEFTIGSPIINTFSVTLQPGLNLVSIPLVPIGSGITSVLSTIDPFYRAVWTYDPVANTWKTWHRGEPSNGLTSLDLRMGFWVDVTGSSSRLLTVQGVPPTSTPIGLVAGYNLVGFPSAQTTVTVGAVKAATGATMIVGFSGSAAPGYTRVMADNEVLLAGNGYYLYVPVAATWTVTY